ncbi:flagellar hook-basal body protein [Paludicola sp. MB14-C6]|uniref:flagellar hook-basal body protein n=1 Tax=Paludihabitans sp. MB14-C6 TaxID=3070656 RepID=UPI0027DC7BC9|nr:flagellar hook-basal body protein [Paludicola sp. MB14-C6]WMJ24229.1 flagellar hook-basal body protein [Paludicola sp. MB14-C6]
MITAFYTASTGAVQLQTGLDVVANNIANVSTSGYKTSKTTFADLVYTNLRQAQGDSNLKVGHGTKLLKTDVLHQQGAYQNTGRLLDYAIPSDNGFFALETANGIQYSRCGNFELTKAGDKFYLTGAQGGFVLNSKGQRIEVKNEEDNHDIGVYTFANNGGLEIEGGLFFKPTAASGAAQQNKDIVPTRGCLENSNVDLTQSMVDMIEVQRAFQLNTRIVQISDEIMQTVNALR